MARQVKTAKFNGTVYRIENTAGFDGTCTGPDGYPPHITINHTLRGRRLLETLIHEGIHASDFEMDEKKVTRIARDLAKFLHRWGYRVKDD